MYTNLGETLGNIHRLISDIELVLPKQLYHQSLFKKIREIISMEQSDWDFFTNISTNSFESIQSLMKQWLKQVEDYNIDNLTFGWTHRDFALRNIRFDPETGGVKHIIDWDHVRYDVQLTDIITTLRGLYRESENAARKFVSGYFNSKSITNLDNELLKLIILGESLCRSLFVICGGVWYDDTSQLNMDLTGLDIKVFELLTEYV